MKRALLVALVDWAATLAVGAAGYHAVAVDLIWIALVAVLSGTAARLFADRTLERRDVARDERAQVIAMGAGFGIEHVPGEDFERFRDKVETARDRRSALSDMRWQEAERVRLHANGITRVHE